MSLMLDSLCGKQRLADCFANEAAMHIVTHDSPSLEVVEVWTDTEAPMEPEDES
jgi:hypothetical protein